MDSRHPLHELIYVSVVEPGAPLASIAQIAGIARVKNEALQITGVLVFDGERFCQYLEGAMKEVVSLFERISADTRHMNVLLVHQGPSEQRCYRQFSMGYADIDQDLIRQVADQNGPAARAAFMAMSEQVDFGV